MMKSFQSYDETYETIILKFDDILDEWRSLPNFGLKIYILYIL